MTEPAKVCAEDPKSSSDVRWRGRDERIERIKKKVRLMVATDELLFSAEEGDVFAAGAQAAMH